MRIGGVFEVIEAIPEIDRVLVRLEEADRCCVLTRKILRADSSLVLRGDRARLISTDPPSPPRPARPLVAPGQ